MQIDMPYGKTVITLPISEKLDYTVLDSSVHAAGGKASEIKARLNEKALVQNAINEPIHGQASAGFYNFDSFFKPGDTVVLIVSDYTRATGSEVYTPILISRLQELGIKLKDITVVIALGLHRPASGEEMAGLVTENVYRKVKVINHNPYSDLKQVGNMKINRTVAEASKVIITGSVTFHPMAGFSGGYKSIIPGIASKDDILQNHKLYFKELKPNLLIEPGEVKGNPLLNDIVVRSKELSNTFCLNVVLNREKKITYAASGEVLSSWKACINFLEKNNTVSIKRKYPVVIASAGGYPADFSFYQSMKVLTNSSRACMEGGTLIILSQCSNGWEIKPEYLKLFQMSLSEITERLFDNFNMEKMAVFMALNIIKKYKVFFLSSLPQDEIKKIGITPLQNRDELFKFISKIDSSKRTAFIKGASYILPKVQGV